MKPRDKQYGQLRSEGALRTRVAVDKKKRSKTIRSVKHKGKEQ